MCKDMHLSSKNNHAIRPSVPQVTKLFQGNRNISDYFYKRHFTTDDVKEMHLSYKMKQDAVTLSVPDVIKQFDYNTKTKVQMNIGQCQQQHV